MCVLQALLGHYLHMAGIKKLVQFLARKSRLSHGLLLFAVLLALASGFFLGALFTPANSHVQAGENLPWPAILALALAAASVAVLRYSPMSLDSAAGISWPDLIAFDRLSSAVAVVDLSGRLCYSNKAFNQLPPAESGKAIGNSLSGLPWLVASDKAAETPWEQAMRTGASVLGRLYAVVPPDGNAITLSGNATPLTDARKQPRGCIVTFHDVTELHNDNARMQEMLATLAFSRDQVEQENHELLRLATRDPLTGCYNRRAFSSVGEGLFKKMLQDGHNLCCIMADIDSFKRVNDTYGHSIGDQAILEVARMLSSHLRGGDLLCRYGGEEFCILLPGAPEEVAMEIVERLRSEIEMNAGNCVRNVEGLRITSSFGVACLKSGAETLSELIELADFALYTSKRNGRNRATLWNEHLGQDSEASVSPSVTASGNA